MANYPIDLVVVSYEAPELLGACLTSIYQHSQAPFHLWVVDNGSQVGTRVVIQRLCQGRDDTTVIQLEENTYYGPAANLVLEQVKGDFVAILNNDIILQSDYPHLFHYLWRHPDVGVVGPKLVTHQNRIIGVGITDRRIHHRDRGIGTPDGPGVYPEIEDVVYVGGSALFCSMEMMRMLRKKDGFFFDPQFSFYYEDFDLCLRAQRDNWKVQYCPLATVIHKHQGTLAYKGSSWRVERYRENLPKFRAKWEGTLPL